MIRKKFWFLYNKWVLRQCPHICLFCKYKDEVFNMCYNEMSDKIINNK